MSKPLLCSYSQYVYNSNVLLHCCRKVKGQPCFPGCEQSRQLCVGVHSLVCHTSCLTSIDIQPLLASTSHNMLISLSVNATKRTLLVWSLYLYKARFNATDESIYKDCFAHYRFLCSISPYGHADPPLCLWVNWSAPILNKDTSYQIMGIKLIIYSLGVWSH